jgi:TolB-like protein
MVQGGQQAFAIGDWLVEPESNRISTAAESVYLRRQLMEVLIYLADQRGRVVTLETLHDELWRGKVVSSGTIYNCIADLRQALARDGRNVEYIETIPKAGYRLRMPAVTKPAVQESTASVALLPLANRSGDPQVEYLCQGVIDEVLHHLKQVPDLRVFSAFTLKDEKLDPRVVGLRFGARTVLTGSLRKAGGGLRLAFRLDDVQSGETLWTDRHDHALADVLEVQESVAREVARALRPALGLEPGRAVPLGDREPRSFEALNAFLLGKYALSKGTEQAYDEAIRYFEKAISLDPGFGRAHYRLYLACHHRRRNHGDDPTLLEKARRAAAAARDSGFRPPVPWIHIERRLHPDLRPTTPELAAEAIRKVVERDPEWGSFAYEQLSWVLPAAGLFRATRDFALHMFDSPAHSYEDSDADEELPNYYAAIGEYDEAIRLWSSEVQKDPERLFFRYERSVLYSRTGQFDYALHDIETIDDQKFSTMARAAYHFFLGEMEALRNCHERLQALGSVHPSYLIFTSCMLGDIDTAVALYAEAVNRSERSFIDLGPLRAMARGRLPAELNEQLERHPRFQALLLEHGVTDTWRANLVGQLNAISHITGIHVAPDATNG